MSDRKPPSQKTPGARPGRVSAAIERAASPSPSGRCSNRGWLILFLLKNPPRRCGKRPMPSSPPRKAMTVLQLVPSLDAGGAERTTIDVAAALTARGDRALVASEGGRLEG